MMMEESHYIENIPNEDTEQQIHVHNCDCRHASTHSSFYCVSRASQISKADLQILSKA